MTTTFIRHTLEDSNNRAVRKGNDPHCITGYHMLWHGYDLQGSKSDSKTDIAVAPLDAPLFIPAGCCEGGNLENGRRYAVQSVAWRD